MLPAGLSILGQIDGTQENTGERKMVKVAVATYGLQKWFGGDFAAVVDLMRQADEKGIDQVSITDHVVMGEHVENYPYGHFYNPLDFPWYEPIAVLSAIAAVTRTMRLSTGVLIAPLRSAVLLAKQIATLDVLSRGRVDIGLGLGWQKEEYDASGIPWEGRYTRLEEQIRVCRTLWADAPAGFAGKTVEFDRIHAYPRPVQRDLPVWFGIAPTDRNSSASPNWATAGCRWRRSRTSWLAISNACAPPSRRAAARRTA